MSTYPRDEFDLVPENSARHGVHRVLLDAPERSLVPLMTFGVAALCLGVAAYFVVPHLMDSSDAQDSAGSITAATQSASPSASAKATPSVTPSASAEPTETAEPTPEPTPEPSPEPAPAPEPTPEPVPEPAPAPVAVVDTSVPVAVFNGTTTSGLAARYAGLVNAGGWNVSQASNWTGYVQTTSVIYFNGPSQLPNAQALGAQLGIATLVDTAEMGVPLAVVLGPGA